MERLFEISPESIRELRRRLGLSQAALAVRLNALVPGLRTTRVTVTRWETGTHPPAGVAAAAIRKLADETP
jgi:DNA-binding transcriptional regulator YiaG